MRADELMRLPARLVHECALGVEDTKDIAARYGYSEAEWAIIEQSDYYKAQVGAVRAEMERSGQIFRAAAGLMSRELMDKIFSEAIRPDTDLKVKTEVLKTLARYADWEPRANAQVNAGPGFSISISVPTVPLPDAVVEGEAEELTVEGESLALSFGDNDAVCGLPGAGEENRDGGGGDDPGQPTEEPAGP